MTLLAWLACNTAPLDYPGGRFAPGGFAPWAEPSDLACTKLDEELRVVDGFTYCGLDGALQKIPVDDPVYDACAGIAPSGDRVLYVTDGVRARAYDLAEISRRELVHDDWGDEPLLIDF